MGESIVMLHGFAGTARHWDGVAARLQGERYRPLAFDLPGHGSCQGAERPITLAGSVASVLARGPARFALCGYSMGGRIALQVALAAPARVTRLVLVSTTAGIEDDVERALRRARDRRLADEIEGAPIEAFIARWEAQPLFAGDPPVVGALAGEDQRRNRPEALAAALRGLGTGAMEPLWERLAELRMPVTVLVGDRDRAYRALGRRMAASMAGAGLTVVPGGHRLALENPQAVAGALSAERDPPGA